MGKYTNLANDIIKEVGGKNNISSVLHCVTRLRFQLKNESKANIENLKSLDGVLTAMKSGGQYQVVIGNHVPDVYKDVAAELGIDPSKVTGEPKKKNGIGATIVDYMSAIFLPLVSMFSALGILKGLLAIVSFTGVMAETDGLYVLLNAAGNGLFYFFPIFLGITTAEKVGMSKYLGGAIGAALVYPTIQGVEEFSVLGFNVSSVSYVSTLFPIILIVILAAPLEKLLNKIVPNVVKTFLVPMIVLTIAVPIGYCLVGPVVNWLSNGVGDILNLLYGFSPTLSGFVIGTLWRVLVLFGLHGTFFYVVYADLLATGISGIYAVILLPAFSQVGVIFAIWLKTKDKKLKDIALPAWISSVFGVSEPGIYGVTLPRFKFFIVSCLTAGFGGAYLGFQNVVAYQVSGMGIFSIPSVLSAEHGIGNFIHFLIAIVISVASAFIITWVMFKDDEKDPATTDVNMAPNNNNSNRKVVAVSTVIPGQLKALSEVEDDAFSQGLLGSGIAIEPSEGIVHAPFDGEVTTLFPTCHAIGLTSSEGIELLVHIGINTVQLDGKYFESCVSQGDRIVKGQKLVSFDIQGIKAAGYPTTTLVIITNSKDYVDVIETNQKQVTDNELLLTVVM